MLRNALSVVKHQRKFQWIHGSYDFRSWSMFSSSGASGLRFISTGGVSRFGENKGDKCGVVKRWLLFPCQRRWYQFRAQRFSRKCVTVGAGALVLFGVYVVLCVLVEWQMQASVARLFQQHEEYPLEEWSQVEPTLREGDVVLLMGTGAISWRIVTAQFVYSLMRPEALRFSHVSVVVEPAQLERWPSPSLDTSGGHTHPLLSSGAIADLLQREHLRRHRKQKRGAIVMEAVDNLDINAPDVNGKVRHECVQLVEAKNRVFGREGDRWCYSRFAVRRLKGFEWTPERKRLLRTFINENVGRPMDKSPLLMLSFIHPKLYEWTGARKQGTEVSCSELIVDLYKFCGVIQRRARMTAGEEPTAVSDGDVVVNQDGSLSYLQWYFRRPSIKTAPFHFAEGMELGVLDFAEGISLGPEVRMGVPGGQVQVSPQS